MATRLWGRAMDVRTEETARSVICDLPSRGAAASGFWTCLWGLDGFIQPVGLGLTDIFRIIALFAFPVFLCLRSVGLGGSVKGWHKSPWQA